MGFDFVFLVAFCLADNAICDALLPRATGFSSQPTGASLQLRQHFCFIGRIRLSLQDFCYQPMFAPQTCFFCLFDRAAVLNLYLALLTHFNAVAFSVAEMVDVGSSRLTLRPRPTSRLVQSCTVSLLSAPD
jgi:hypothetical protein